MRTQVPLSVGCVESIKRQGWQALGMCLVGLESRQFSNNLVGVGPPGELFE